MEPKADKLNKEVLANRKKQFDDLMRRRLFFTRGFEIYGGVAGLQDYGPTGCAIKNNLEQLWREWFVLEEDMLEVNTTCITPETVLKASGHVDRFTDLMVKDEKAKTAYRADKLLAEYIETRKQKEKEKLPAETAKDFESIMSRLDGIKQEEMSQIFKKYKIKSPETGNDLGEPEPFNLMFKTHIGPTGDLVGQLRPETAQGIFLNFHKLLEFNGGRIPFGSAQIGLGFRNEIAPRSGLLRVREFQMAEIEYFVDPQNKSHPKFHQYANHKIPLFSAKCQEKGLPPHTDMTLGDAVKQGIINNEALAYFLCRTQMFLVAAGCNPDNIRFRQHQEDEMAHYATDCWDAEIETSHGWIEVAGHADRSAYDLKAHTKASGVKLLAARKLKEAQQRIFTDIELQKPIIGKLFKKDGQKVMSYIENLGDEEKDELKVHFETENEKVFSIEGQDFKIAKDMLKFSTVKKNVMEEKFIPNVIEPSFGLGRVLYCILEHSFKMRDEKRTYVALPPRIAPVKCSLLPVISNKDTEPFIEEIRTSLKKAGISVKVDDSGQSIGKRYARTDEIGIPFAVTVDKDTIQDKKVTLRELVTLKQVRLPISEVTRTLWELSEGLIVWSDVTSKYPLFEVNIDDS